MLGILWRRLVQFLLPTRCAACQRIGPDVVCQACLDQLNPIGDTYCLRCGRRRETAFVLPDCGACHGQNLGVVRARSLLLYRGVGRDLLAEFKFHGNTGAGYVLGGLLAEWAAQGWPALFDEPAVVIDITVPVPLHKTRQRKRCFNQAELLARLVARRAGVDCAPEVLRRKRSTEAQVGLTANQRRENVRGAFSVPERSREDLAGKRVLLVDDLMTTGATLAACARSLRRGGAAAVYGLTLFSTHRSIDERLDASLPRPAP